jgi:aspartyl/glutamyl-tRNA(Asn/Gln) amidotransferase C subunit
MEIKDVEKLAELAKIELREDEKSKVLSDMEGILEYVKVVEKVEVPDVEPVYTQKNVWREDLPAVAGEDNSAIFSSDLIIKQFPDSQPARPHDGSGAGGDGVFLKVKKIL